MFAAIKAHLHWFRNLGVHDLDSPPLQPSPIAWAQRFCDDWQEAANRDSLGGVSLTASAKSAYTLGSVRPAMCAVPVVSTLPAFTLRYPGSSKTRTLWMTSTIEWPAFHAARAYPRAANIDRLMDTVDCDLAKLEFGCSPLQSLSEIVLALEFLRDVASTAEEARMWTTGTQILFQLSVAHDYDAQIDLAWVDKFRAVDAKEPWACYSDSFDLPAALDHVAVLKRVATELRSVLQGSYSDARDIADDVGDALDRIWRGLIEDPATRECDTGK